MLRKTLDMFERQMIQQNRAFPFMGPVQSEAETFRIEVVPDPPLAPWQPRQRAPPEPLRSPLNSNTVVHLVRNGTQYLTNIQGQGAQTFRAQYRYNLIVAHNSVLAYTTWKDNAQACYFTLSSEKEETSKEVHAFTDLKLQTFYTGVAITDLDPLRFGLLFERFHCGDERGQHQRLPVATDPRKGSASAGLQASAQPGAHHKPRGTRSERTPRLQEC